jgi:hypothetical protein
MSRRNHEFNIKVTFSVSEENLTMKPVISTEMPYLLKETGQAYQLVPNETPRT